MNNTILLVVALMSPLLAQASVPAVTVQINNRDLDFSANPRLTDVLASAALQQRWYWPVAALYQTNDDAPMQLRAQLVQLIATLSADYQADDELHQTLKQLQSQISSWQLAKKIALHIDYDLARLSDEFNPRLDNGRYLLQLKTRPASVYISGIVQQTAALAHKAAKPAADYMADIAFSAVADKSQLVIMQPDGRLQYAGTGYWNKQHIEAMPGAQIIVLIKTSITDRRFDELNQLMLELAGHRIFP